MKEIDPKLLQFGPFAQTTINNKYAQFPTKDDRQSWKEIAWRVASNVLSVVPSNREMVEELAYRISIRQILPGGRYLYAAGRPYHQVQNCLLLRAEDSREGWSDIMHKASMALMSGAGIGIEYSEVRPRGSLIRKTGGEATGPCALMQMVNESGRHIMQGGSRRSAIWAGLGWNHQDIYEFINMKNWSPDIRALKAKDYNFPAPMDGTNISVRLDDDFFAAYHNEKHPQHSLAQDVYWKVVRQMLETSEPGFSIDVGENAGETLRNACTEVTSYDDSDICNLGSINLARIHSLDDMRTCTELATLMLVAGTVYSDVPYAKVDEIRTKNRRLGLGLMGLHEWLLLHGKKYGPDSDLAEYLKIYEQSTYFAHIWERSWGLSPSAKTRAIAPTGTIGIAAETTTGMEPMLSAAIKRRYLKGTTWEYQYVIDTAAKRLVEEHGVDPDTIEDAYTLAEEPTRRLDMQVWLQGFTDHGISSTINLPSWGSKHNNEDTVHKFGNDLITRLPHLRGVTCYADGSRGGQPLTAVKYATAMKHVGQIFVETGDVCDLTKGGSCGA